MKIRSTVAASILPAVFAISCGGSTETASPVAPAIHSSQGVDALGTLSAAMPPRTLICHIDKETGLMKELNLPQRALEAHLKHGDTFGSCLLACPCFTTKDIEDARDSCTTFFSGCGSTADLFYLALTCQHGSPDSGSVSILGIYIADMKESKCSWGDTFPPAVEQTGLSDAELAACRDVATPFCPEPDAASR